MGVKREVFIKRPKAKGQRPRDKGQGTRDKGQRPREGRMNDEIRILNAEGYSPGCAGTGSGAFAGMTSIRKFTAEDGGGTMVEEKA